MSDDQIVKQFPYSLKVEATAQGFRVSAHAYGENMEQVVTDTTNMVSKALTELEFRELGPGSKPTKRSNSTEG